MRARLAVGFLLTAALLSGQPAEVAPGIWRVGGTNWGVKGLPVISAKGDSNVYVLRLPGGPLLLDCATIAGMPLIERNIRAAGFDPSDIKDIVFPHSHADHTEATLLWQTRYGVRTHMSAVAAKFMERKDPALFGDLTDSAKMRFLPFKVDHAVADGEVFDLAGVKVTATWVPGHTLDSTLFTFELGGKVIGLSGDFVFGPADWNPEGGGLGAMRASWFASLSDYRDSLKKVLGMKIDMLLPGHGRIIDGSDAVRANLQTALSSVEELLKVRRVYVFGVHKPQLGPWLKQNR